MQRLITSTLAAFTVAGIVVSGQQPTPTPPTSQQPTSQQPTSQQPKETLSGCVVEAKTTDGGTAYVLNKAEGGSAQMYVLMGLAASEWAGNVSKKVEVTGAVVQPNAPPPEDAATANPRAVRPPIVQAESVKVLAETCT